MEVGKIHRNWKEKMIFMSFFLQGWKEKKDKSLSE